MNVSDPVQRNGAQTNGQTNGPTGGRPSNEGRSGAGGGMSRAERFDDEKRRIVESCFAKKDADGSLHESYITHIRIFEDAAHPSSPPPPDSAPENKKPRLIIVAVRKTGRVRIHKARENANGTFSIGKTWNLDDLTSIESFTGAAADTEQQQQRKQWAGGVGFIVTVQKPYYWQAATPKEKEFFIASLVKIYRKYTGGKLPELVSFDPREMEAAIGPPARQGRENVAAADDAQSQRRPASAQGRGQPAGSPNREPRQQLSQEQVTRRPDNREPAQLLPGQHPPTRPAPAPSPLLSQAQTRSFRAESPGNGNSTFNGPGPPTSHGPQNLRKIAGQRSVESFQNEQQAPNVGRIPFNTSTAQGMRQDRTPSPDVRVPPSGSRTTQSSESSYHSSQIRYGTPPNAMPGNQFRSRSRPPIPGPPGDSGQQSSKEESNPSNENFQTPLSTPGLRKEGARTPSRDSDRLGHENPITQSEPQPAINGYFLQSNGPGKPSMDLPPGTHYEAPLGAQETQFKPRHEPPPTVFQPPIPQAAGPQLPSAQALAPQVLTSRPPTSSIPQAHPPEAPTAEIPALNLQTSENFQTNKSPATPTTPHEPTTEIKEEEVHRPGLGPMIKKKSHKDIANQFRKAANIHNAFKPRPGGAGDRIREERSIPKNGPDGITSVVPAPSLLRGIGQGSGRSATPTQSPESQPIPVTTQADTSQPVAEMPQVEVTSPDTGKPTTNGDIVGTPHTVQPRAPSPDKSRQKSPPTPESRKQKRRSERTAKYISALGINPILFEDRAVDIEPLLSEFGWEGETSRTKQLDTLEADIKKELGRVEAGSWLGHLEQKDERVGAVEKMLDKAIAECDELEGLLTLYGVELNTLNEDIAYIEAQSQGLQVQTANQKLLHDELDHLLKTISIPNQQLLVLREASLGSFDGIGLAEQSLSLIYKAMITIDPSLRGGINGPKARMSVDVSSISAGYGSSELGNMKALQEKKVKYRNEGVLFVRRLRQYMNMTFGAASMNIKDALGRERAGSIVGGSRKLNRENHDESRSMLWKYSPLMLFAREFEILEWEELMRVYEREIKVPYRDEFRESVFAWKRAARKPTGDEQSVLFTSQERESEGIATTARKMTVKRSQTLAKTLRAGGDGPSRRSSLEKAQEGKMHAYEAFAGALDEMVPIMFMEQNFMVDFFHLSSSGSSDFSEAVAAAPPEARKGTDLTAKKPFDPDRNMAKRLAQSMDEIYSFWSSDMQNLVDWASKADPLQGVGVLGAIELKLLELEETNQEYLIHTLQKLRDRLTGLFSRFLDEQIRAIEETKVKIKKRKGIIAFMKIFPVFVMAIENMLPPTVQSEDTDLRFLINDAYRRVNKAMFESLKVIAKETPAAMAGQAIQGQGVGDPEDKEALNYHILLIENMNHYIEEVDARENGILQDWKRSAAQEMNEHMELYLGAVIRRPLGKLLDFLESTESLLLASPSPPSIATRASHSRSTFKKILANYDNKELRRGIDTLKKRIEKHFGDADDPALSRGLVQKVLKECENRYLDIGERTKKVIETVYEGQLEVEWRKEDVSGAFRR